MPRLPRAAAAFAGLLLTVVMHAGTAAAAGEPDPRFLRIDRLPAVGTAIRLTLDATVTVEITIGPRPGEDAPETANLDGLRRLDAVLRTLEEDDAADRSVLEVLLIDGEVRFPGTEAIRLPIGRRFRVTTTGDEVSVIEPGDAGAVPEAATLDALRILLDMAGAAVARDRRSGDPAPDETAALGLGEPRSIGETWALDPATVARLADLTVDDLPPTAPSAASSATRLDPVTRDGQAFDRLEVRFTLDTSDDEAAAVLREIGARGAIDEGSSDIELTLELSRRPGSVVLREVVRTRATAVGGGLADSPRAGVELDGTMRVTRTDVTPAEAEAAIVRARLGRTRDEAAITRANERAAPWGLQFDGFAGDPRWTPREPDSDLVLFEAEAADGATLRVLRPDAVGRHGGSMAGLDEAVGRVSTAGPGFSAGEAFDLAPGGPTLRARYGVVPGGGGRWFVWTFLEDRPVVVVRTDAADAAVPDRTELIGAAGRVGATDAGRADAMAAHPGVLSLGGDRAGATPPSWLGASGGDLAARGPGWRMVAWTLPFAIPDGGTLVMLDAVAEMTGFARRPDAAELSITDVRRMGRDGSAAVTGSARLEVLAGESDTIVILGSYDRPPARQPMLAAIGRLVLTGPIVAGMPPVEDGPIGEAARARTAAAFVDGFGLRLLQLDVPRPALAAFDRAQEIAPGNPGIRLNRARALAALGRGAEAARLIDGDPALATLPVARRLRARLSLEAGDAADARQRFEALLAEIPDPQTAANLVITVRELDGSAAAIARGDAWMQAHAEHPVVLLAMAIVAGDADDPAEALGYIDRAIALAPEDPSLPPFRDRFRAALGEG